MKQHLRVCSILVFIFISSIQLNATEFKSTPRKSVGLYINTGMSSYNTVSYCMGVRGRYEISSLLQVGAELNYNQHVYPLGNYDAMGALTFLRLGKLNKGFYAEGGMQAGRIVSSSRANPINKILPYCALGYSMPLKNKFTLDLQIRPITAFKSKSEMNIASSALEKFFVGLNYNF
jgi:hypothetical protein